MQPTTPATHDNLGPSRLNFCPIASLCRNESFVHDTRCDKVCFTHLFQFQQDRSGPADSSPKTSPFSGFASAACEWPSGKGLAGHAHATRRRIHGILPSRISRIEIAHSVTRRHARSQIIACVNNEMTITGDDLISSEQRRVLSNSSSLLNDCQNFRANSCHQH